MAVKFKIPWKNGNPDLTPDEWIMIEENNVGFSGAEPLNYNMPDNKALVYIYAPDEIIEQMKSNPRFSFVEE